MNNIDLNDHHILAAEKIASFSVGKDSTTVDVSLPRLGWKKSPSWMEPQPSNGNSTIKWIFFFTYGTPTV
jgi:hypothetical protein